MARGVYIRTEEHRQALKVPRLGSGIYKKTEEHKAKLSKLNIGKHLSSKTEFKKGHRHNEEWERKMLGRKLSEEHRKKIGDSHRGEKSSRWIKDRTKLQKYGDPNKDRRSSAYGDWRKQVWKRDNFKCKISNQDCAGRLEAHHILGWSEYPELRYEVNNGITLCRAHHPRKRAEEKKLIPYFMGLVEPKV